MSANPGTGYVDSLTDDFWVKFAGVQAKGWRKVGKVTGDAPANMYRLKSVADDYVVAMPWDGVSEVGVEIPIAKEPKIRTSLSGETALGVVHTYSYIAGADSFNLIRVNNDGVEDTNEYLWPPWVENEIVFAVPARTDLSVSGVPVIRLLVRQSFWKAAGFIVS